MARTSDDSGEVGYIVIKRRYLLQDAARSYTVFIDGEPLGKMWALQMKSFTVVPGHHELQLKIVGAGRSCSDVFKVDVSPTSWLVFRTHSRGLKNFLMLPFAMPAGIVAQVRGEQLKSRHYEWPWIRMALED